MKKASLVLVFIAVIILLVSCGKKNDASEDNMITPNETAGTSITDTSSSPTAEIKNDGEYIVFSVTTDAELMSNSWLGLVPLEATFQNEAEADDFDLAYTYIENAERSAGEKAVYRFSSNAFDDIENGEYAMVLCDTDDGDVGAVIFEFGVSLKDGKITLGDWIHVFED